MALSVSEEENGNRSSEDAPQDTSEDAAEEFSAASAQILDKKSREALECPCLDDLRNGPCGSEFTNSFVCYLKSKEPGKGSDCIEYFNRMQRCMMEKAEEFTSADVSGTLGPVTELVAGGDDKTHSEDEEMDGEGEGELNLPDIPNNAIKLPLWQTNKKDE